MLHPLTDQHSLNTCWQLILIVNLVILTIETCHLCLWGVALKCLNYQGRNLVCTNSWTLALERQVGERKLTIIYLSNAQWAMWPVLPAQCHNFSTIKDCYHKLMVNLYISFLIFFCQKLCTSKKINNCVPDSSHTSL